MSAVISRGYRNNNPGDLRFIVTDPWDGQIGQDGEGFGVYASLALGTRALACQLRKMIVIEGLDSLADLIPVYAPADENDTAAYLANVSKATALPPFVHLLWPADALMLMVAMITEENGYCNQSGTELWTAVSESTALLRTT